MKPWGSVQRAIDRVKMQAIVDDYNSKGCRQELTTRRPKAAKPKRSIIIHIPAGCGRMTALLVQ